MPTWLNKKHHFAQNYSTFAPCGGQILIFQRNFRLWSCLQSFIFQRSQARQQFFSPSSQNTDFEEKFDDL
jgi:hypothetical protein